MVFFHLFIALSFFFHREFAQIGLSADIAKCNVTFTNLQWSNTTNHVLINSIISTITIINSTISHIGFSLLGSGSSINLINSVVTNCTGWQPVFPLISSTGLTGFDNKVDLVNSTFSYNKSPLISIKTTFSIQNGHFISNTIDDTEVLLWLSGAQGTIDASSFTNNVGTIIDVIDESVLNMTSIMFDGNNVLDGSLIDIGKGSSLLASVCSFIKSYGMSLGPVIKIGQHAGNVNLTVSDLK